jgi:inosose dehydratase
MTHLASTAILYTARHLGEAVSDLSEAGYEGIELQPHHALKLAGDAAARAQLSEQMKAAGLVLAAAMPGYLSDRASLEVAARVAGLVAELGGAHLLVLPARHGACEFEEFVELLGALAGECEQAGVAAAVHHHAGTIVDTPERIDDLLGRPLPSNVGLCFDVAHYALFADDEADAARRYAAATRYVHVKDLSHRSGQLGFVPGARNGQQSFRVPGDGVLDVSGAIRELVDAGYDGWLSLETENFYRSPTDALALGRAYMEQAIA